jgi:anthranilate synthase component 2
MIVIIDNYDSFSYNLYQMLGSIKPDLKVIRNDALTVEEIDRMKPEGIILSPGPGRPEDAGVCIDLVKRLGPSYPLLGVCLGHQAICTAYGAVVSYAKELMHGKVSECGIDPACPLFAGLDSRIRVGRYHSLAALEETMPECLKVTARTGDGEIMAVKHAEYDVYGVQFHPESILTPDGEKILRNFIDITGKSLQ